MKTALKSVLDNLNVSATAKMRTVRNDYWIKTFWDTVEYPWRKHPTFAMGEKIWLQIRLSLNSLQGEDAWWENIITANISCGKLHDLYILKTVDFAEEAAKSPIFKCVANGLIMHPDDVVPVARELLLKKALRTLS